MKGYSNKMKKVHTLEDSKKKEKVLLVTISRNPGERWEKFDALEEMALMIHPEFFE